MKHVLLIFVLCMSFGSFVVPGTAHAEFPFFQGPLVPCGNETHSEIIKNEVTGVDEICVLDECNVCNLVQLAKNIIDFFVFLSVLAATLMFMYAGALYIFSGANPGNIRRAHSIFWSVLLGLVAVLAAWLVVDTVMRILYAGGEGETHWGPWNVIICGDYNTPHDCRPIEDIRAQPEGEGPMLREYTCLQGCEEKNNSFRECVNNIGGHCGYPSDLACVRTTCGYEIDCKQECEPASTPGSTPSSDPSSRCPAPGGDCSVGSLGKYFGDGAATMASICYRESGGNPTRASTIDRCLDGNTFSWGLFQINLTVHKLNGVDCPSAFRGKNFSCVVINPDRYKECVSLAKNPTINLAKAAELYRQSQWRPWRNSYVYCFQQKK